MLDVESDWSNFRLSFTGLKLRYKVKGFDCGIRPMNEDLQELLKSEQYPYLYLEIHSIELDRDNTEIERLNVASRVSITLSGITREFHITDGMVINQSAEDLIFRGKRALKLTDFNIEPPTKFFGLVQVTNELKVDFEICMHVKTKD